MDISVIIPVKDRAYCIERTLNSILRQSIKPKEIIIIDDNSIDNLMDIVNQYRSSCMIPIIYRKNDISLGGAVSRNIGAKIASGHYIAFLDSDDVWLSNHLESKIKALMENNSEGAYGKFVVIKGDVKFEPKINKKNTNMAMIEYIISGKGDARTSTFVFNRASFNNIKFDENLMKHQDWDLAIRFGDLYQFVLDENISTVMYASNDSMSKKMNHNATKIFLSKHISKISRSTIGKYYIYLAMFTLITEGKNNMYEYYLDEAKKSLNISDGSKYMQMWLLKMPFINFSKLINIYRKLHNLQRIITNKLKKESIYHT